MSRPPRFEWSDRVFRSDLRPPVTLTALALHDEAGRQFPNVRASYRQLCGRTRLGRSTVVRSVRQLADGGWLVVVEPGHGEAPSRYILTLPEAVADSEQGAHSGHTSAEQSAHPEHTSTEQSAHSGQRSAHPGHTSHIPTEDTTTSHASADHNDGPRSLAVVVVAALPQRLQDGADLPVITEACRPLAERGWTAQQLGTTARAHGWESARSAGAATAWLSRLGDPPRPKPTPPRCDLCAGTGWLGEDEQGRAVRCTCRRQAAS